MNRNCWGGRHFALPVVLAVLTACTTAPLPENALILENVNIVDVEGGGIVRDQDVVIADGGITKIVPTGSVRWPRKAQYIDLQGAYLTPSLYDLHAHVFDRRDLQLYALMGVQTIRNMDGWDWHIELRDGPAWTDAWIADMHTTGGQYQKPVVKTAAELKAALLDEQEAGYDWFKLYDNVDKEMAEAIAGLNRDSVRVTGHLPAEIPLADILKAGVFDDVAHAEELLRAMRSEFGDWRDGLDVVATQMKVSSTAVISTLVNNKMIVEQVTDFESNISRDEIAYAPPLLQMFWASDFNGNKGMDHGGSAQRIADDFDDMLELVGELSDRGVAILAGTDASNPTTVPAFSLYEELELLVDAGLSPAEALRAATVGAATHLGQNDGEGRIVVDAPASMTVTRENPLTDVSALRSFDGVFYNGEYKPSSEIDKELSALREAYMADLEFIQLFEPSGPQPIFDALAASKEKSISAAGLESLIWIYMKFGNQDAVEQLRAELSARFPDF